MLKPREKSSLVGYASLSMQELLMLLVGHGNRAISVSSIAQQAAKILQQLSIEGKDMIELEQQLLMYTKIPAFKVKSIIAALEIGKRMYTSGDKSYTSPMLILPLLEHLKKMTQEVVSIIFFDLGMKFLHSETLFKGTNKQTLFATREIFLHALRNNASRIIIAHNHPSGECRPSNEDTRETSKLIEAGRLLDIEIVDHIIISKTEYFSFKMQGYLQ